MTAAARIAERLRALSARERILLLLGAVAIALFLVVRLLAYPAAERYRKARAEIPVRRAAFARYEAIRGGQAEAAARLAAAVERLRGREEGLLPGDDPSASGAVLQGILKPKAARQDTRMTSIRTLAPAPKGEYAEVAVQMDLQTTTEGLAALLAEVAREPRILRIRKLTVSGGIHSAAQAARPETLTVSIVVAGMAASKGEQRTAAGGAP
jgi:hypothetical protein